MLVTQWLTLTPFADASYYLTRNSLNYVTPVMMQDKALALSYTQIGGLTSILPVCYGMLLPVKDHMHTRQTSLLDSIACQLCSLQALQHVVFQLWQDSLACNVVHVTLSLCNSTCGDTI